MNTTLCDLQALQQILRRRARASAAQKARVQQLEKNIVPSMLEHFYHQLACDRRAVALVRNGVCGECHIRLPSATLSELRRPGLVPLCENCGCYVALPAEEAPAAKALRPAPTPAMARDTRKEAALAGA
jgi:predicted  nucleic acid-binding Zn-ribbon protein